MKDQCLNVPLTILALLLFSVTLVSCAGKPSRTEELLAMDYTTMVNDDLQLHYYQLEDQIVADERKSARSSFSIGLGTGRSSYGSSHSHGGIGMSTGTNLYTTATELRNRRNEVRMELQKRGVTP